MAQPSSWGAVGHWSLNAEGAEEASRVQTGVSMRESLPETASLTQLCFIIPGMRAFRGRNTSLSRGQEGLIAHNTAPNYQLVRKLVWDLCASSEQGQTSVISETLSNQAQVEKGKPH